MKARIVGFATTALALVSISASAADPPAPVGPALGAPQMNEAGEPALSAPADLPAPPQRQWVNRPLLITSSILLLGSYVPAAVVAYESSRPSDHTNLYYPVVGPWMNLSDRQCDVYPCSNESLNKALLIAGGIGQGLGALGVITSLFIPNKTTRTWYLIGNESTHIAPGPIGIAGFGVGAAGQF